MFDPEFFPTPKSVLELMGIDAYDKTCLEPSSGKGDIIDYLNQSGANEVLCCEQNKDLATISARKGQLIANDFFTVNSEQVSHVNMIVMNPPFVMLISILNMLIKLLQRDVKLLLYVIGKLWKMIADLAGLN